LQCLVVHFY